MSYLSYFSMNEWNDKYKYMCYIPCTYLEHIKPSGYKVVGYNDGHMVPSRRKIHRIHNII